MTLIFRPQIQAVRVNGIAGADLRFSPVSPRLAATSLWA